MPRPPTCWNALAPSTELPLVTLLPRAWIGFGKAPWRCVGLATALLLSAIGPALLGEDLRQLGFGWLGDLMVAASLVLPLLPLLALLRLADQLLPAESASKPPLSWGWMLRQATGLVLLELLLRLGGLALIQTLSWAAGRMSTTLAGLVVVSGGLLMLAWLFSQVLALPLLVHHRHRALQAMDHSRQLVRHNGLKVLALLGLLIGINLLGLIVASLGLLLSLPFSALLLMACCRTQTPCSSVSRRNMLPT